MSRWDEKRKGKEEEKYLYIGDFFKENSRISARISIRCIPNQYHLKKIQWTGTATIFVSLKKMLIYIS